MKRNRKEELSKSMSKNDVRISAMLLVTGALLVVTRS